MASSIPTLTIYSIQSRIFFCLGGLPQLSKLLLIIDTIMYLPIGFDCRVFEEAHSLLRNETLEMLFFSIKAKESQELSWGGIVGQIVP